MKHAIFEIALIGTILKGGSTFAIFLTKHELTLIDIFVVIPGFYADSVLLIIGPSTFVIATLGVTKDAMTISLTVSPLALIDITICMGHPTSALEDTILRESFIFGFVWKDDCAEASATRHFSILTKLFISRRLRTIDRRSRFIPMTSILPPLSNIYEIIVPGKALVFWSLHNFQ